MKNAVYHHAVEFLVVSFAKKFSIRLYGIQTYKEVAGNYIALTVVKGYDIGIVIVLQILAIHLEYFFIIAEHIGHFAYPLSV